MEKLNPTKLEVPTPEKSSRGLALATLLLMIPKLIMTIPHLIILYVLGIAAFVVSVAAQIVVLFTGKYPPEMHKFVVGTLRWRMRVSTYLMGLRDEYPQFTLD